MDVFTAGLKNEKKVGKPNREGSGHARGSACILEILILFIPEISRSTAFKAETTKQNPVVYP